MSLSNFKAIFLYPIFKEPQILGALYLTRLTPDFVTDSLAENIALFRGKVRADLNESSFKNLAPEPNPITIFP